MSFGETYLAQPDLFPGRLSGERWGAAECAIDFVGGPYLFRGLSETQAEGLRQRFQDLCVEPDDREDPAIEIRVFQAPEHDFLPLEPRPWREVSLDLEARPDSILVAAPNYMGRIEYQPTLLCGMWTPVESPYDVLVGVFENLFRIVVAYRLNQMGGALLHSAGVIHQDQAFLFFGPSGAGKSTISRLSLEAGKTVLSDDMNALAVEDGRIVVEKLPFAGDLGQTATRSASYPVRGLYRLEQAPDHAVRPVDLPRALALLVSCSPYLNSDSYRTDRLLGNLEQVLDNTPLSVLAFRRDADFWPLLLSPEKAGR